MVFNLTLIILAILYFTKLPAKTRIMEIHVCSSDRFISTQHNLVLWQTKLSTTCKYLDLDKLLSSKCSIIYYTYNLKNKSLGFKFCN